MPLFFARFRQLRITPRRKNFSGLCLFFSLHLCYDISILKSTEGSYAEFFEK